MIDSLAEIQSFLDKIDVEAILQKTMRWLPVQQIVNATQLQPLESKRSFSEMFNPEESAIAPATYEWRNIKLNKYSRTAEFNNKNLRDEDLIREVPKINCFKNIKEF